MNIYKMDTSRILPKESFLDLTLSFLASLISFVWRRYLLGFPDLTRVERSRILRPGDSGVSNVLLSELKGYSFPSLALIIRTLKQ